MLVDVLMLMVFVDGHPHAADLGQHHLTHPGLYQQVDAGDRVVAQQQFVHLGGHPFGADPGQLRGHLLDGGPHPRGDGEAELGHEPRGAQHPQRVVAERLRRRRRGVQHPGAQRRQPAQRIEEFARPIRGDPHRHRVRGEIAAHQVVVEAVAEAHLGIARHPVVAIGAEGGDLQAMFVLADADGAVFDPGIP